MARTKVAPLPVVDRLRSDILSGAFHPGERLVEMQLAERYVVGRATVRAALVELDAEGLVTRSENRGATVRRISVGAVVEITEARAAIEGLIARRAAERATKAERAELRSLIVSMERAVKGDELTEYAALNKLLHHRLGAISRHAVAAELAENLRNRAAHHQFRLALLAGRPAASLPQHKAIVKAVVAGDADRAEAAMHEHIGSVIDVLRRWEELGGPV